MLSKKFCCPDCGLLSDTIRVKECYSRTEYWEVTGNLNTKGEQSDMESEDTSVDEQGVLDDTTYMCGECDFESSDLKDFFPDSISRDRAEKMFKDEIAYGTINTATTPHYDSVDEYIVMLKDTGFEVKP